MSAQMSIDIVSMAPALHPAGHEQEKRAASPGGALSRAGHVPVPGPGPVFLPKEAR